ncbi:uncharacterized protein LOC133486731 isoform X3 [Phyllopteryx taeniolatus]|uniref:uncharacterized protein LOC133486731 isoform X3 n=1 Tax=Phyllopteryx taeniolatus TaxID=161469 RepID=UPI002AD34DFB|nr:uncharacterized protein LOC133486731 isoform X3 [Phyllopteryx taeniolatus]
MLSLRHPSLHCNLWKDVSTCKQTNTASCNVAFIKAEAEHGCVRLGVQAERRGLTSELVEACSRQGIATAGHPFPLAEFPTAPCRLAAPVADVVNPGHDRSGNSCSPEVSLDARPGFLTLHLNRKSKIALEGNHIKHRIYFGKKGELLEAYEDAVASVSIDNLKEGEHYCARVQYTYFDDPVGLARCTQCEVIPHSSPTTTKIEITVTIVILFIILIPVIAYIPLFQRRRIKEWLKPPYKIPDPVFFDVHDLSRNPISSNSPTEEFCDITSMELRGQRK